MIKVMIVEDEALVRLGLKSIIEDCEGKFIVCAEANNGLEAQKLMQEDKPDIILLDIKMPHMDGIEFLREKKKLGDSTPVIVLSCHGEYEYVREAMKLGASDYILKLSAKPENLPPLLEQIYNESKAEDLASGGLSPKTESQKLLYDICTGHKGTDQLSDIVTRESLPISLEKNDLIYLLADKPGGSTQNPESEDGTVLSEELMLKILEQEIGEKGVYTTAGEDEYVIVLPANGQSQAEKICSDIQNRLISEHRQTVSMGMAQARALDELYAVATAAKKYAGMRFYLGPNKIVSEYNQNIIEYGALQSNIISSSSVMEAAISRNKDVMLQLVDRVLSAIESNRPEPSAAVHSLIEMNVLIITYVRQEFDYKSEMQFDIIEYLRKSDTLVRIEAGMKRYIELLFNELDEKCAPKARDEIKNVLKYISEHYREHISLKDIAGHLHMSTSRFCVIFKEGTGQTFVDYLNMVRIKKAEEILMRTDSSVNEIAYQVGFNNTSYFIKIFKRITDRYPSEYRRH